MEMNDAKKYKVVVYQIETSNGLSWYAEFPDFGGLGDVKVKRFLNSIMQEELEPIRNRRKEFEKDIPAIYEMLRKGCEVARAAAADTLSDVRKAMKINYFDDAELINEQVKRFNK